MVPVFDRVLLATEGTPFDAGAERVAIDLAHAGAGSLFAVVPLLSNVEAEIVAPLMQYRAEAAASGHLEALRAAARAQGLELVGSVRRGEEPYREIVDEAAAVHADLIVLRRRGKRSYLANLLLGEMVHTVIGHAPCHVLIVPRAAALWRRHLVLATDGSPHSERATHLAASLAARSALPVTVVSAQDRHDAGGQDARLRVERAIEVLRAAGIEARAQLSTDKPAQAILAAAQQVDADLIVLGRRGLNRVGRLLVGSTSESVAGNAASAVLIAHA